MAKYRKESHARSLIKGASWRIVATTDTIVVVAIVTSFTAAGMSIGHAIAIGGIEFLVKYVAYYLHERLWEELRKGHGLDRSRTLKKAISWRIVATIMTFVISVFVLKSLGGVALAIAIIEFFTKFVLYYLHERIWTKIPLGKIRNWLMGKRNA